MQKILNLSSVSRRLVHHSLGPSPITANHYILFAMYPAYRRVQYYSMRKGYTWELGLLT